MPTQTFTSSGTWTAPTGVFSVDAECWAAGGGGGGGDVGAAKAGGGGGGGAYSKVASFPVVPGNVYTITVGAGGIGGLDAAAGTDGGNSWFDATSTVLALGGAGGQNDTGGAGGSTGGAAGSTLEAGGAGADGDPSLNYGGGGGSSGGSASNGTDGSGSTGGVAPSSGGNGGDGLVVFPSSAGTVPGVGGGGGGGVPGSGFLQANNGADGQIILTWTAPPSTSIGWFRQQPQPQPRPRLRPPGGQVLAPFQPPAALVNWWERDQTMDVPKARTPNRQAGAQLIDPLPIPMPEVQFWIAQPPIVPAGWPPRQAGVFIVDPTMPVVAEVLWWMRDQANDVPRRVRDRMIAFIPFVEPLSPIAPAITVRFHAAVRGLYRIFNAAGYRFYRSSVAPPAETDSPFATSATLPSTPANTYVDGTWYLSASYFDGVLDSGFLPLGTHGEAYLVVEIAGGVLIATRPHGPSNAFLTVKAGGVIRVNAFYLAASDPAATRANEWSIGYTTNGSTPAIDSPTHVVSMGRGGLQVLAYDLPAQADGTTVKVQLQTRHSPALGSPTYSLPGTVLVAVADAAGPTAPLSAVAWPGGLPEDL